MQRIENIAHLIRLETLMLDGNNIAHLSGLEYLKELKTLSVCKNRIESIENLPAFSKVRH
jgi:Leucine-rich repeat (LRR) protein